MLQQVTEAAETFRLEDLARALVEITRHLQVDLRM